MEYLEEFHRQYGVSRKQARLVFMEASSKHQTSETSELIRAIYSKQSAKKMNFRSDVIEIAMSLIKDGELDTTRAFVKNVPALRGILLTHCLSLSAQGQDNAMVMFEEFYAGLTSDDYPMDDLIDAAVANGKLDLARRVRDDHHVDEASIMWRTRERAIAEDDPSLLSALNDIVPINDVRDIDFYPCLKRSGPLHRVLAWLPEQDYKLCWQFVQKTLDAYERDVDPLPLEIVVPLIRKACTTPDLLHVYQEAYPRTPWLKYVIAHVHSPLVTALADILPQ